MSAPIGRCHRKRTAPAAGLHSMLGWLPLTWGRQMRHRAICMTQLVCKSHANRMQIASQACANERHSSRRIGRQKATSVNLFFFPWRSSFVCFCGRRRGGVIRFLIRLPWQPWWEEAKPFLTSWQFLFVGSWLAPEWAADQSGASVEQPSENDQNWWWLIIVHYCIIIGLT